jgi:hypothetical protein
MYKYLVLLLKTIFFLISSAVFSIPAIIILIIRHGGIAGGPQTGAITSIKSVLILIGAIGIPLILIALLGWSLFSKKVRK